MNKKKKPQNLILFLSITTIILVIVYQYKKYRIAPTIDLFKQEVYNENNELVNLENYNGKKTIIAYYASWCGDCLMEMESLNKIKNTDLSDVEVIAITDESQEKLIHFKNKKNYPFTFLRLNKSFDKINIYSIPVTYVINNEGKIVYEKTGAINWDDTSTLAHIKALLN